MTCVFCDRPADSWEHAWPAWMLRFIEDRMAAITPPVPPAAMTMFRDEAEIEVPVCDSCNRGWMRKLEDRLHPKLKAMMVSEPTRLSARDTHALRRWALKTAVVMECFHQPVTSPTEMLRALHRGDSPPHALVTIGRYRGIQTLVHYRVRLADALNDDAYMSWVTLVCGHVLIQVMTDIHVRNPDASLSPQAADYFVQLPPGKGIKLDWPCTRPVNDASLDTIKLGPDPATRAIVRGTPERPPPQQRRRPRHR